MKITSREIVEILKTARELGYREFRLEHEGLQLAASSIERANEGIVSFAAAPAPTGSTLSAPPPQQHPAALPLPPPQRAPSASASPARSREGLIAIAAPMSGTFYCSPSPGAPPFVQVGSQVNANDIVCIIEVMKLFNSIRASAAGVITEIPVENEGSVVAGQPVIWIKPAKG